MKDTQIDLRDRRMLELLASGASGKSIAKSLGYREGTTRVYLHHPYRKLGVANKTCAVIWFLERSRERGEEGDTEIR